MTRATLFLAVTLALLAGCDGETTSSDDAGGHALPDAAPVIDAATPDAAAPDAGLADAGGDPPADAGQDGGSDAYVPPVDSDCDGLVDGPSREGWLGEDLDDDGELDEGETDPDLFDTDGDGLSDGVERGVVTPFATCADVFVPDEDPTTTTDPARADTDADGIEDGVEDEDRDGQRDEGETDPGDGTSPPAPISAVCTATGRTEVALTTVAPADLALVLPRASTSVEVVSAGTAIGALGHDVTTSVAFVALRVTPADGLVGPLGLEESLRPALATAGALSEREAISTTTWDGAPAVVASYTQASTLDADDHANALAGALAPESTGRLPAATGPTGAMQLRALYVLRSATEAVVLLSVAQRASASGPAAESATAFVAHDFVAGAALGTAGDALAPTCRLLTPLATPQVDVLLVVDDSGSMQASQLALAEAAHAMALAFESAQLDWRMGLVTSSYIATAAPNALRFRRFSRNANLVRGWLTENSTCVAGTCSQVPITPEPATCPGDPSQGANGGCWIGLTGAGTEAVLGSARAAIAAIAPGTAPGDDESPVRARQGARLVVILVGDADDQTTGDTTTSANCGPGGSVDAAGTACVAVADFVSFFGEAGSATLPTNPTGAPIPVHGIVCPSGAACGCTSGSCDLANSGREFNPQPIGGVPQQRHAAVVAATGGVLGSIRDVAAVRRAMDAITRDTIARTGHALDAPLVAASLRVALSAVRDPAACDAADLPRSTVDGYRYDPQRRSLAFYGACRPATESETAAVSFQRWAH
ncbi:adventurous gliding motility lipoprotein CglD [Sandaracinus amylolyticus]|uniref:Thrombospondin type 3 repeat family n=1 Tax=Sandaracinus amylolyticus TaxID=927083 RepID=A0A0F6VYQ9_9BACT|nr:adventurous gliding motility lipoprotein CglD [Sandaracinus amylolyticus]AKF02896.1 Thrombospondin type 3 repeat family [Sandaracinus amylolyticus]